MVQMSLVRLKDWAVVARAPYNGKRGIENRQPECENRHDERYRRRTLDRTDHGDAREDKAEEHAARIAHEDACGVEIVVEEADCRARESRCHHRHEGNSLLHRHEEDRDGGNGGHSCRKPVEPVDEVDRIRQPDNPEDRRGNSEPFKIDEVAEWVGDKVDPHVKRNDEHGCGDDLSKELHLCRQVTVVVNDADSDNDRPTDHEPDEAHHVLRREIDEEKLHQNRHHKCSVDPDAANARDGAFVHLACIGLVECPRTTRKGDDRWCQDECHTERDHKG